MSRSGLFAMYNNNIDAFSTAASIYYGLFSMQHRGMDASGICINQNGQFKYKKEDGMVIDIFDENVLGRMEGHAGIGHVLYSKRSDVREYAQPIVIRYTNGQMAVALNGGLINTEDLRKELELQGAVFRRPMMRRSSQYLFPGRATGLRRSRKRLPISCRNFTGLMHCW